MLTFPDVDISGPAQASACNHFRPYLVFDLDEFGQFLAFEPRIVAMVDGISAGFGLSIQQLIDTIRRTEYLTQDHKSMQNLYLFCNN